MTLTPHTQIETRARNETDPRLVHTVWTYWTADEPLDRPRGFGINVGRSMALAKRLAAAIEAGVVFTDAEIRRDVNGATYVSAKSQVMGRRVNADLTRLGF